MRFAFQDRPYDLVAVFVLSAVIAPVALFAVTEPGVVLLGFIFILFAPGYVLTAALFPGDLDLGWIERLALTVGLSISLVALIGLGLNFTSLGILLEPVLVALLLFITGVGAIAYWRRMKLPHNQRLSLSIEINPPNWSSYSRADKVATVALAASLAFAAGTVVYVVVTPRPAEHFTEFYMLNETGVAIVHPMNLTTNQTGVVKLTVHNLEYAAESYTIVVVQATMAAVFNASANQTQYRVVSQAPLGNLSLSVADGGYWNDSYSFHFTSPGIFRLYFYLYKLPDTVDVYRYIFLTVFVSP